MRSSSSHMVLLLTACALVPPWAPAAAQSREEAVREPSADSAELHGRAREAQRRFERMRARHLPRVWDRPTGPCDVRIGRLCQWHDPEGDWTPHPPVPDIEEGREELLGLLARVGARHPGDGWILGQRVQYLAEAGRWEEARRVARSCPVEAQGWWCAALLGFALHGATAYAEAERAFDRAMDQAPDDLAAAWRFPDELLDRDARGRTEEAEGEAREGFYRRFWALADPLYLVPGNDRRTAHLALRVLARIREDGPSPFGGRFGGDFAEALVRYGWEVGWERSRPRMGSLTDEGSVISQQHPRARRYVPTGAMLADPVAVEPGEWVGDERTTPATYAPAYAPEFGELEAQVAVFRTGDSVLVVGAYRLPPEEGEDGLHGAGGAAAEGAEEGRFLFEPPEPTETGSEGGLFLVPWSASGPGEPLEARRAGGREGVLTLRAPVGTYLVSLEHLDRDARRAGRYRLGVRESAYPPGVPVRSDLLLLRGEGALPETLEEAIPLARPGTRIGVDETLRVGFTLHGLRQRERLTLRLTLEPADTGLLRRAGEWIGILDPESPVALDWEEMADVDPGLHFRGVELRLPEVEPGSYVLRLSVALRGRTAMVAERRIEVVP